MTKKDFEAVANIINQNRFEGTRKEACESIAQDFADMFAEANPRFDVDRFMAACGFPD